MATAMIEVNIEVSTDKQTIKRGTLNKTFKFTSSFDKQSIRVLSAVVSGKIDTYQKKIYIGTITSIGQSDRYRNTISTRNFRSVGGIRRRNLRSIIVRGWVLLANMTRRKFTVALIRRKILLKKKLIFSKILELSARS